MSEILEISNTQIRIEQRDNHIWKAKYNEENVLIIDKDQYNYEFIPENCLKIIGQYRLDNINKLVLESLDSLKEYLENETLSVFEIKKLLISLKNDFINFIEFNKNDKDIKYQTITLSTIFIKKENNELIFKMLYPEIENNNNDVSQYNNKDENFFYSQENLNGSKNDEKDYIWSLGIILYYIIQKKYPFEFQDNDGQYKIDDKIKKNELKFEKTILDNDLKNLIEKMLNKEKETRIGFTKLYEDDFFTKKELNDYYYRLLSYNIMNSKLTIINLFRLIFVYCENKKEKILLDILINIGFFIFRISFHILSSIIFNNDDSISFHYHKGKNLDKLTVPNSISCLIMFTFINFLLKTSNNWKYRIIFLYSIFIIIQFFSLILSISFFNVFENTHRIIVLKVIFNYFLCNCYIFLLFFINAYLKREYIIEKKKKYENFIKILEYII